VSGAAAWRALDRGRPPVEHRRTTEYCDRVDRGEAVATDVRQLGAGERVEEALFTGLRMNDGIGDRNFLDRYGVDPWSRYEESLRPYVAEGFMWRRPGSFGLTRRGMLVANDIFTNFV
jgi:oxygen-independent coproporphyrinogen-3 oxidase